MAATDLFTWIDALWNKEKPEGTPPFYIIHRFLAADKNLAQAARYLQSDLRQEPQLMLGTWQALLPKGKGAPRLSYVAPKKPKAAEALTLRMMTVLGESRVVVEDMQALIEHADKMAAHGSLRKELYLYYGCPPPEEETPSTKPTEPTKAAGGLLGGL